MGHLVRTVLAVTPVSWWTLLVAVAGTVLSLVVWRPVVRASGWGNATTLASALLITAVLALTMGPGSASGPGGIRTCVRAAPALVETSVYRITTSAEALLNLVFLVPLGVTMVLATRRPVLATMVILALPGAVELTQTRIPGRVCSGADYVTNVTGGLVGIGIGVLTAVVWGRASRSISAAR